MAIVWRKAVSLDASPDLDVTAQEIVEDLEAAFEYLLKILKDS